MTLAPDVIREMKQIAVVNAETNVANIPRCMQLASLLFGETDGCPMYSSVCLRRSK